MVAVLASGLLSLELSLAATTGSRSTMEEEETHDIPLAPNDNNTPNTSAANTLNLTLERICWPCFHQSRKLTDLDCLTDYSCMHNVRGV
jgi:hypothetical protein